MAGKFRFQTGNKFSHTHYADPDKIKSEKAPGKQKLNANRALMRKVVRILKGAIKKLETLENKFATTLSSPYVAKNQFKKLNSAKNDLMMAKATLQDVSVRPVGKTTAKLEKLNSKLGELIPRVKGSPLFIDKLVVSSTNKIKKENALPIIKTTIKKLEKSCSSLEKRIKSVTNQMDSIKRIPKKKSDDVFSSVVEVEEDETTKQLTPQFVQDFFTTASERGWTVNTDVKKIFKKQPTKVVRNIDEGMEVIKNAALSKSQLLTTDVPIGLLEFPIILVQKRRLSERMIKDILKLDLGYEIHIVLGGYLVVTGALLMGIHKSMIRIYDNVSLKDPSTYWNQEVSLFKETKAEKTKKDKLKIKLDTSKFEKLVPFLQEENPHYKEILSKAQPTNPAMLYGSHYYCPLFPQGTETISIVSIENWSPIFEEQKTINA